MSKTKVQGNQGFQHPSGIFEHAQKLGFLTYKDLYSEEITKKLAKLKKKYPVQYSQVRKKMDLILADPTHSYKFLTHDMKGVNRVHLGHFVLVFRVDHNNKTVSFEDYEHHDKIYGK